MLLSISHFCHCTFVLKLLPHIKFQCASGKMVHSIAIAEMQQLFSKSSSCNQQHTHHDTLRWTPTYTLHPHAYTPQRLNTHIGTHLYTPHTRTHTMDNSYQKHLASVRLHCIPYDTLFTWCMIGSYGFCATPEKEFGGAWINTNITLSWPLHKATTSTS